MDLVLLTRKQLVHIEVYMFEITKFSFRNERPINEISFKSHDFVAVVFCPFSHGYVRRCSWRT